MNDAGVIEVRIAQIFVDVGERHAVELAIGQTLRDLRLEELLVLCVLVVRIAEIFWYRLIVGLRHEPENGRFLLSLTNDEKNFWLEVKIRLDGD